MIIRQLWCGLRRTARGRWCLALLPAAVVAGAVLAPPAAADGTNDKGLALHVTVNTRPGVAAVRPGIRVGHPVVKRYRLVNRGGADLYGVRVSDPGMPGARIRCPGGGDSVRMLPGLRSVTCTAQGSARSGNWTRMVTASGRIPYLRAVARASERSGYAGVGGALTLRQTARVTGPAEATVRYLVGNRGNRPLYDVQVTDPVLRPARIDCARGTPVVPRVEPGKSAVCTAVVRRDPGAYPAEGQAAGTDRTSTLGRGGEKVAPPRLTARASARFVIPRPPPPSPPSPPPPPPRTPAVAPPAEPPAPPPPPPPAAPPAPVVLLPPPVLPVPLDAEDVVPPPGIATEDVLEAAAAAAAAEPAVPPDAPGDAAAAQPPAQPRPPAPEPARRPILSRFFDGDGEPTGLGLMAALFLILIPAAVAAAVLGSRRK